MKTKGAMEKYSSEYWNEHYLQNRTGWDIGYVSGPLKEYFVQLKNKDLKILIPGAGNAYEVEFLFHHGFTNTWLLDFSEQSILNFLDRCPDFPADQIIKEDYFDIHGQYDLIIEQTFFSSIPPQKRHLYSDQVFNLLKDGGKYVGLLFNHEFPFDGPPFGGTLEEYQHLFSDKLIIDKIETAINSIGPRSGREFFVMMRKSIT